MGDRLCCAPIRGPGWAACPRPTSSFGQLASWPRWEDKTSKETDKDAPKTSNPSQIGGRTGERIRKAAGARRSSGNQGAAYEGALEAVLAVPIALGLGYWADDYFGTAHRYLLIGGVLGFAAFVLRLMRMAKLVQQPEEDQNAKSKEKERENEPDAS